MRHSQAVFKDLSKYLLKYALESNNGWLVSELKKQQDRETEKVFSKKKL